MFDRKAIDSAPRDGSVVLFFVNSRIRAVPGYRILGEALPDGSKSDGGGWALVFGSQMNGGYLPLMAPYYDDETSGWEWSEIPLVRELSFTS